jgi:hypothetical protein
MRLFRVQLDLEASKMRLISELCSAPLREIFDTALWFAQRRKEKPEAQGKSNLKVEL